MLLKNPKYTGLDAELILISIATLGENKLFLCWQRINLDCWPWSPTVLRTVSMSNGMELVLPSFFYSQKVTFTFRGHFSPAVLTLALLQSHIFQTLYCTTALVRNPGPSTVMHLSHNFSTRWAALLIFKRNNGSLKRVVF